MRVLITGSAGHLGEALIRCLSDSEHVPFGIDIQSSAFTQETGCLSDRRFIRHCMQGCDAVIHTATLHKPHVATHSRQDFIDTNITGTLNLLEEASALNLGAFIYTSTTSTFGDAMRPAPGEPAVWVTEALQPKPKNIYGVSKVAAEGLCELFHRNQGLPCIVLRTSRFFPEADDNKNQRDSFDDANLKVNELLYRRADIQDVVDAHLLAMQKAPEIGFDRFIISAASPFQRSDLAQLGLDATVVVRRLFPHYPAIFEKLGWEMLPAVGRVYDSSRAQQQLGWSPVYTFEHVLELLNAGEDFRSPLTGLIGLKGYHDQVFDEGPYPVEFETEVT